MGRWLVVIVCAGILRAQSPARTESPETLLNAVETSIFSRDLTAAYDAAARLDDAVQARLRASQSRDAAMVANRLLTWLPPAAESLVFDQRAFAIGERTSRADVGVMTAPLARLNGGGVWSALRGSTVRIAAASAGTYFYFFDAMLNARLFGNPELLILGRPFWRGDAETWFTLARPDLLIVSGSRDVAAAILGRVLNGSSTRALPNALPEWGEVERQAPLWGLSSRGVTFSLDAAQKVEIHCLGASPPVVRQTDFQISQPRKGLWVLRSDGGVALAFAFGLLGPGDAK